ncbi:hypothetical protein OU819_27945 (plasmid) [Bacillus cereus]|nr:hypothetical protein [Bacillus cereus]MDA2630956.1 hypothetical protein [Bacillus cereus]WAI17436.1 hypothetical protein OU819_27945 [Bacillus cereus]
MFYNTAPLTRILHECIQEGNELEEVLSELSPYLLPRLSYKSI